MVRHNTAKPCRPVLPSCLGVPVAVIQDSHVDALLPQLPPWFLLASPVPGAYLTTRDAFHCHSQQPYTNSHCEEEHPNNLLTGQLIVSSSSSKYLNV